MQGIGVRWTAQDQMRMEKDITFEVQDASCTPQTAVNPFGAVKDGRLKACCFTLMSPGWGRIKEGRKVLNGQDLY